MLRSTFLLLLLLLSGNAAQAQILETFQKPSAAASAAEIERATWQTCSNARTATPCEAYLRKYPKGSYASIAQSKIEDLRLSQPAVPVVAPMSEAEREAKLWAGCEIGTTAAPCNDYVAAFPSGGRSVDARARILKLNTAAAETAAFAQCQAGVVPGACGSFVSLYPRSPLVAEAKAQDAKHLLEAKAADRDKRAFAACKAATKASPCEAYVAKYPSGPSAESARLKIRALATNEPQAEAVQGLGLYVKRTPTSEVQVLLVQRTSSTLGKLFGGDIILKINDEAIDPRVSPGATLDKALVANGGSLNLLIRRGASTVTVAVKSRP